MEKTLIISLLAIVATFIGVLITNMVNLTKEDKDEKKKKRMWIILVTLLVIMLGIGGFLVSRLIPDPPKPDPTPTPAPSAASATPAPTPDSSPVPQSTITTLADRARIKDDPEASNTFLLDTYTSEQFLEIGKFHEEGTGGFDQDDEKALENYLNATEGENPSPEAMLKVGDFYWEGKVVEKDDTQAFLWWKKAAEAGSTEGMYRIGYMYATGSGTEKNYVFARKWFEDAGPDHAKALYWLGRLYHYGLGVNRDDEKAFYYFSKSADLKHPPAMNMLGLAYENGWGCDKDIQKAIEWFTAGADAGNTSAMFNLGFGYYNGSLTDSGKSDHDKALEWYRKAVDAGHIGAINNLAILYYHGHGVDQDRAKAAALWQEAAEKGNITAMVNLAAACRDGIGVPQALSAAEHWYEQAAEAGSVESMVNLADICYFRKDPPDHKKALKWYLLAAEKDDAHSQYMAGYMLLNGQGTDKDLVNAEKWLEKAAEQDQPDAVRFLANRYIYKEYQPDTKKVISLFEKAAALQEDGAYYAKWLGWFYEKGEKLQKDITKAFAWYKQAAEGNDSYAQYRLGVLMLDKNGPKYVPEEAVENLEKSAGQNNISAIQFLADRYLYGDYEEISQATDKAITLYEQGVELGNADFADWLSRLYSEGNYGIEKNEEQADYWAKEAARIREQNAEQDGR